MALIKRYVMGHPPETAQVYTRDELRKIETAISSLLADLLEEFGMPGIESGQFIPVVVGAGAAGVGTYTLQHGQFYKIGRLVFLQFRVITTAHTGTGQMRISNLPFKATSFTDPNGGFNSLSIYNGVAGGNALLGLIAPNTTRLDFLVTTPIAAFNVAAVIDVIGSCCYLTD